MPQLPPLDDPKDEEALQEFMNGANISSIHDIYHNQLRLAFQAGLYRGLQSATEHISERSH